jgi:hypothetical protein
MDDFKEHKSMPKKAPAAPAPTGIKTYPVADIKCMAVSFSLVQRTR